MNTYTTVFFENGIYQPNKHKLQNLRSRFNIVWDESKLQENVPYGEILNIYSLFKVSNRIVNDVSLKDRKGAIGLWKNDECALKIIVFDAYEGESLPVLMVYKGDEECEFYRVMMKMCIDLGCEIGRLEEDENGIREVFKRKLNKDVVDKLRSAEESKEVMSELFDVKINELVGIGYKFSDLFISEWKENIKGLGYYSDNDLKDDIEELNEKSRE